jgi:thymidylate synthase (FAD)
MAKVLDKGWVTLEDSMPAGPAPAADKKIEKRARVSNKLPSEVQDEIRSIQQTDKLLNYLLKNGHTSPFEGAIFEFYVKCPLFVRSEWMRHRTWSYNEMSGRYVEYEHDFYIPDKWRIQAKTNKQGSLFPDENDSVVIQTPGTQYVSSMTVVYPRAAWREELTRWLEDEVNRAYATYEHMLKWGVAKEMARMVLPANLYTAFYGTVNAHNLMKFLRQRNADNAQWEIHEYAFAVEEIFKEKMPITYEAWVSNGRGS